MTLTELRTLQVGDKVRITDSFCSIVAEVVKDECGLVLVATEETDTFIPLFDIDYWLSIGTTFEIERRK